MDECGRYDVLAGLFDYPCEEYPAAVERAIRMLVEHEPAAAKELRQFLVLLPADNVDLMQELFTRSFDVQAITTLDIGYVLFGDDYLRGELLANLHREHARVGNRCGTELADHLPNVLRLLGRLDDRELVEELVQEILAPAVRTMIDDFAEERIAAKSAAYRKHYKTLIETPRCASGAQLEGGSRGTIYRFPLRALYGSLRRDFHIVERVPLGPANDFLNRVLNESEIEDRERPLYRGSTVSTR